MQNYIKFHNHFIDTSLHKFICEELENENLIIDKLFWKKLSNIIEDLEKRRIKLIKKRAFFQNKITQWHKKNKSDFFNKNSYKRFLYNIGYIVQEDEDFKAEPELGDTYKQNWIGLTEPYKDGWSLKLYNFPRRVVKLRLIENEDLDIPNVLSFENL